MTLEEALNILGEACAAYVGNLAQHRQIQSAYEQVRAAALEKKADGSEEE